MRSIRYLTRTGLRRYCSHSATLSAAPISLAFGYKLFQLYIANNRGVAGARNEKALLAPARRGRRQPCRRGGFVPLPKLLMLQFQCLCWLVTNLCWSVVLDCSWIQVIRVDSPLLAVRLVLFERLSVELYESLADNRLL